PRTWPRSSCATTYKRNDRSLPERLPTMTVAVESAGPPAPGHASGPPAIPAPAQPWLAAVAVVPILATVYQTLVLTDVTDDVIRKGIDAEHYSMIWTNVCWGVATLYGVFAGIWAMARFGGRDTLLVGLAWFALGNLLCGAAAAAAADRLDRCHPVRGLDREPDLHLRLVPQVGRLDVQCLHGDRAAHLAAACRPGLLGRRRPGRE